VYSASQESILCREMCAMQRSLTHLSDNMKSVENRQIQLGAAMDELKELMKNFTKNSFSIKGSIYEVHV